MQLSVSFEMTNSEVRLLNNNKKEANVENVINVTISCRIAEP